MAAINPLTTPQQCFLQRLLALHVVTDIALQNLWRQIYATSSNNDYLGRDLNDTLSTINRSLKPAFGLEIRSISMPVYECDINSNDNTSSMTLYHAVVNCNGDEISKATANTEMNPHEVALLRLILERFIEVSQEDDEADGEGIENEQGTNDGENTSRANRKRVRRDRQGRGCQVALSRVTLINLRTELKGAHAGKLSITEVENALNLFVAQGWLVKAGTTTEETSASTGRRKKRTSFGGSSLQLGPRSYMEFSDFLIQLGMDQELLPQILIHG
jgi:Nse1 non-SMC component of SMC5-6 complex.